MIKNESYNAFLNIFRYVGMFNSRISKPIEIDLGHDDNPFMIKTAYMDLNPNEARSIIKATKDKKRILNQAKDEIIHNIFRIERTEDRKKYLSYISHEFTSSYIIYINEYKLVNDIDYISDIDKVDSSRKVEVYVAYILKECYEMYEKWQNFLNDILLLNNIQLMNYKKIQVNDEFEDIFNVLTLYESINNETK